MLPITVKPFEENVSSLKISRILILQLICDLFKRTYLRHNRSLSHLEDPRRHIVLLRFCIDFLLIDWLLGLRINFHHRCIFDAQYAGKPIKDNVYLIIKSKSHSEHEDRIFEGEDYLQTGKYFGRIETCVRIVRSDIHNVSTCYSYEIAERLLYAAADAETFKAIYFEVS